MDGLCQACLCSIGPSRIPLCLTCYDKFLALPVETRLTRIAEMNRNDQLSRIADSVVRGTNSLVELIDISKHAPTVTFPPFRN